MSTDMNNGLIPTSAGQRRFNTQGNAFRFMSPATSDVSKRYNRESPTADLNLGPVKVTTEPRCDSPFGRRVSSHTKVAGLQCVLSPRRGSAAGTLHTRWLAENSWRGPPDPPTPRGASHLQLSSRKGSSSVWKCTWTQAGRNVSLLGSFSQALALL